MTSTNAFNLNDFNDIMACLETMYDPESAMARAHFAIPAEQSLGIPNPVIHDLAKKIGKNQELSLQLWDTGIHEARLLATLTGDPKKVTAAQMERWIKTIQNWAVCDGACGNLFWKTPWAYEKAMDWSAREPEFEKRAGFALMAMLAVHDKKGDDQNFIPFFSRMEEEAGDDRNFVKKAINWALRQCGKRSHFLHAQALAAINRIRIRPARSAQWIASDAWRELNQTSVLERLDIKRNRNFKKK